MSGMEGRATVRVPPSMGVPEAVALPGVAAQEARRPAPVAAVRARKRRRLVSGVVGWFMAGSVEECVEEEMEGE